MYKIEKQDKEVNVKDLFPEYKKTRKEFTFLDEQGNVVDKEQAVKAVIREYDEKDRLIKETWGTIERGKSK